MNYLITAAGKGSRFLEYGIKPPKPLIRILGIELLIWSINSFNFKNEDKLYIATYIKHNVPEFLDNKIRKLYPNIKIEWFETESIENGQLLTALKAISHFKIKGPLIIHNCDTAYNFDNKRIQSLLKENIFGIVPCFKAEGDNWSFARTSKDDSNFAIEITEKKRISDNCSVGTYIFSSTENFVKLSEEYLKINKDYYEEFFIAPIYQLAIEKNKSVRIILVDCVKNFGNPRELINTFKVTFEKLLGENAWDANQRRTLIVDIDKTICHKDAKDDYSNAKPIQEFCKALKKADEMGIYIVLFTSRNMRTYNGSLGLINKFTSPKLINWLKENNVPYDEIYFGKPWGKSVSYIDDKSLSIKDFLKEF